MAAITSSKKWGDVADEEDNIPNMPSLSISDDKLPPMDFDPSTLGPPETFVSKREIFTVDGKPANENQLVHSWEAMGLKNEIITNLKQKMEPRHTNPFQLHELSIPLILSNMQNSAVIVHAPTGHGKTAAFTVPILQTINQRRGGNAREGAQALVLTSKRNLARQHHSKVLEYAQGLLNVAQDGSSVPPDLQVGLFVGEEKQQGKGGKGGKGKGGKGEGGGGGAREKPGDPNTSIAVGTLQKVLNLLQKRQIDGNNVKVVVFDEVDEMLEQGADSVNSILASCPNACPLFVSATVSQEAEDMIRHSVVSHSGKASKKNLLVIRTEQKTRPAFQANFILLPHESKLETLRRLEDLVQRTGKKIIFTTRVENVEAVKMKYCLPESDGGIGIPGTIAVHANSHSGDMRVLSGQMTAPEARKLDMETFKTDASGDHDICICTDDLARGINIETIQTVINLDLPLLYDKSGGGKGGKGGRGTFTGLVDEITYIHRLGRATRSETAHGLCINIVGGVEEQVDALGMLQHLKASDKLEAFGRHYDVQRDIYSDGPVSMEVMVGKNDKGIEMWETIDEVTVNRVGEDELGWTVSFMHNGQLQQDVPLNHDMVHAPFDFTALDEEMKLFNDKANIEGALIKLIRINSYDTLKDTISEARKVIDALGSRPREASEKAASASWPWREKAIEFLERLIKEAIFEAHKHSKTA